MRTFTLRIATVGKNLYEGSVHSLTASCIDGELTILAGHEPYVSTTVPCTAVIYDEEEHRHDIELSKPGVLEVSNNHATILL